MGSPVLSTARPRYSWTSSSRGFRLWLKDHLALYGVKNAVLAPGYRSPDQSKGEQ
jgi:hypothetical protein